MNIMGYSERGVINALFYEIAFSPEPERLIEEFLKTAHFPFQSGMNLAIHDSHILVEQSLSDFGDADAIMLLHMSDASISVFAEAKVKPSQRSAWRIEEEFNLFMAGTRIQIDSSNLFAQLYHKVRFTGSLKRGGLHELTNGVPFPVSSSKAVRKIGANPVVLRAVEKISRYLDRTYFLAMIPDNTSQVDEFFERILSQSKPEGCPDWDASNYGYISWHTVEEFCEQHGLTRTLEVFEFNKGQIY